MNRDHSRPKGSSETTEAPAAQPSHAERSRSLAARARMGTLCTIARDPAGYPYGTLVTVVVDSLGRPILLISSLAEHTGNLMARSEASVMLAEAIGPDADPLALGRLTLLGTCAPIPDDEVPAARETFLAAHPRSSSYVGFKDFRFFRLEVTSLRYIGGFGRMSWVDATAYREAKPDPLIESAGEILAHMNDDHGDAVIAYAKGLAKVTDVTAARMTAVDRYGFDITVTTPEGERNVRIPFEAPVESTDEVRMSMVALVKKARAQLAGGGS